MTLTYQRRYALGGEELYEPALYPLEERNPAHLNHGDDASRAVHATMLPLLIEQTDTRLSTFSRRGTRLPPTSDRSPPCPRLPAARDPLAADRARGPEAPTPQK